MSRYIPPGREDLYRRQTITDAEVKRLEDAHKAAERKARELAEVLDRDDSIVEGAEYKADRLYDEWNQAQAIADRVYQERTAGLSYWIDTSPHLPVCSECGGTGVRVRSGRPTSCRTCRGWGREDDGRGHLPYWHEGDQTWRDPATGREVEVPEPSLDDPPEESDMPTPDSPAATANKNRYRELWAERERARANEHEDRDSDEVEHHLSKAEFWTGRIGRESQEHRADQKKTDPPPTTRTTGSTGATAMPNIEEARAGVMKAHQDGQSALAALGQAHEMAEDTQNAFRHATEGSNQPEADQAHGQLAEAVSKIDEARQQITSALQEFEGVAQRL